MKDKMYLKISEFGPIRQVKIEFSRFTFFVGPQGTGKSTIAKLYSMFLWLEKRLVRGLDKISIIEKDNRFRNKYCNYHRLSSYFYPTTVIEFRGMSHNFLYKDGHLRVVPLAGIVPGEVVKVMYVPSERSFLSSLRNLSGLKTLPESLQTFKEEYDNANNSISKDYKLPINNTRVEYDRLNNISWLVGEDYRVRLSDASSGFQAVVPLLVVSQYLTDLVASRHKENRLSVEEREKLMQEVKKIMGNGALSPEVREAALASLSVNFEYSGFVNVVEEPEENLFPASQRDVLNVLLALANREEGNRLVVTTHSPYLINYLTLSIKGRNVLEKGGSEEMVEKIVPAKSCVASEEVSIYELKDGRASLLPMPDGLPSDTNYLNEALGETNTLFGDLLELEYGF